MDKDALLLELPELDVQSILAIRNFIESFLFEFDAHYYAQLRELLLIFILMSTFQALKLFILDSPGLTAFALDMTSLRD